MLEILSNKDKVKRINYILLIMCFLLQAHYTITKPILGPDMLSQTSYAVKSLDNISPGLYMANPEDLSQYRITRTDVWAPGYQYLVIPLLPIVNGDYILANSIITCFGILLIILFGFKTLQLLLYDKPVYLTLLLIYWSVAFSPFRNIGPTDSLSLGFFILSTFLLVRVLDDISKEKKLRIYILVSIGITAFLCSFFRFAYYPISFIPGSFLILYYIYTKRKPKLPVFIPLITTSILIISQLVILNLKSGSAVTLAGSSRGRGVFIEHLIHYDSIFFNSFFSDSYLYFLLNFEFRAPNPSTALYLFLFISSAIILSLLLSPIYKRIQSKGLMSYISSLEGSVVLFLTISSASVIGFIGVLSVTHPSIYSDRTWLWIMISRYFVLVFITSQLLSFLWFAKMSEFKFLKYGNAILLLLSFLFCLTSFAKNTFFDGLSLYDYNFNLNQSIPFYDFKNAEDYIKEDNEIKVFVMPNENEVENSHALWISYFAIMSNAYLVKKSELDITDLKASQPIALYWPMFKNSPNDELIELSKKHHEILKLEDLNCDLYRIKLNTTLN